MKTSRHLFAAAPLALACVLSACGLSGTDRNKEEGEKATADAGSSDGWNDPMASRDLQPGAQLDPSIADDKPRPIMQAQVVLDRLGFGPGVIDGKMGLSTKNALEGFQKANNLNVSGELDEATKQALSRWSNIPATRVVTIPQEFANEPFQPIPEKPEQQAKMQRLGYENLDEKLAERFHTTIDVLKELNAGGAGATPTGASATGASAGGATTSSSPSPSPSPTPSPGASPNAQGTSGTVQASVFRAGQEIRVPNIGADRIDPAGVDDRNWLATLQTLGVGTQQPKADKVVVDKSEGVLEAYDAGGKLVAVFTVTSGSSRDPLPLGDWKILAVSHNPHFAYNPELFWDVPDSEEKQQLPPGPNGPVGVVWIDLSKEHYGIHGTPEPQTIGRAQSHGCVRLTNWDAARLAQMVSTSTKVSFVA
jgi:lipoprotein-anchoring transpeptidase ErfK/SrfK